MADKWLAELRAIRAVRGKQTGSAEVVETHSSQPIDWLRLAMQSQRPIRKTIRFGRDREEPFEVYIREMSIVEGGLDVPCGTHPSSSVGTERSIIAETSSTLNLADTLSWIYENGAFFHRKDVIELGSGCGLCGIVAGRTAQRVVLSDYLDSILENLRYIVTLNTPDPEDPDDTDDVSITFRRPPRNRFDVMRLDWDEIGADGVDLHSAPAHICQADVIIGSELTYSLLCVHTLARVIARLLKADGVFLEILSDDRAGVGEFCDEIRSLGFRAERRPVRDRFLGNYFGSQHSENYGETYSFWTFQRVESSNEFVMQ